MKGIRRIAGLLSLLMLFTACFGSAGVSTGGAYAAAANSVSSDVSQVDVTGHEYLVFKVVNGGLAVIGCSNADIKKIEIPGKFNGEPVINIAKGAFKNLTKLETVIAGKKLENIRESAFKNCPALSLLVLPDDLKTIADNAFIDCPNIVIDAAKGTVGRKYARENNIPIKGVKTPEKDKLIISGKTTVLGGGSITLKATFNGKNADVEWSTSDKKIATVSKNGKVSAKNVSEVKTVTIKATLKSDSKITATKNISVAPPATKVTITSNPANCHKMDVSDSKVLQLYAKVEPAAAGQGIKWSTSNFKVAKVSKTGLVTAVKAGDVIITATATDGSKVFASWKIKVTAVVKKITLTGKDTLLAKESTTLTVKFTPGNATNKNVEWSSENKSAATVDKFGKVTAKNVDKVKVVTICATSEENTSVTASHQITIIPLNTKIKISADRKYINLNADRTLQLTAVGTPEGSSQSFEWKSSDTKVIKVNKNGLATGLKVGKATITATATDGSGVKGTFTIRVVKSASGVKITGDVSTLHPGMTTKLTATVKPKTIENKKVSWSSSNTAVATVSANGHVKAKPVSAKTEVIITAASKVDPTITGEYKITIIPYVSAVTITSDNGSLINLGGSKTLQLRAACAPADADQSVKWSSSNTGIATVNDKGLVTGHKAGSAVITAAATDGSGVSGTFTVQVAYNVTNITIDGGNERTLIAGEKTKLVAVVTPVGANKSVTWTSGNNAIAAVAADGTVTAKTVNVKSEVIITATTVAYPYKTATVKVTVIPKATSVTLPAKGVIDLSSSTVLQLTATVTPADAAITGVTWSSSNNTIATVNANGLVTGKKIGTVNITATVQGKSATCAVTVKGSLYTIVVSGESTVKRTKSITLTAATVPSTYTDTVTWSSSNNSIATVNAQTGVVTGVAIGTAVITATSNTNSELKATKNITVEYYADSIVVTPATGKMSFIDEGSLDLNAQVLPAGDTQGVTWESLDAAKAAVNANGVVTSTQRVTQATNVKIRAKWNDEVFADATVKIIPKATGVTLPETGVIGLSSTNQLQLTATIAPADAAMSGITWTSSDSAIATVSATGLVTGLSVGAVDITATVQGESATCAVTVKEHLYAIEISGESTVKRTKSITLTAATVPSTYTDTVTWSSSNTSVATVNPQTGVVTGVAIGAAVITATSNTIASIKATKEITVEYYANSVTVTSATGKMSFIDEGSLDLNAQVLPAGDTQGVTWVSLDTAKAAVDANGLVTSLQTVTQATDVTIRAKWNDEIYEDATVKIIPKATGVTLPATGVIGLSSTNQLQLTATTAPADAAMSGITWTSSNSAIATVSATGLVTGLSVGTVNITATVQGESATCAVTVKEHLYAIEISGESTVKRTKSITLTAATVPSTNTDTVTWSSSNTSIATVNPQTGAVTGVATGTAEITATSNTYAGIKATKTITVVYYADSVTVTSANGKMSFIDEGSLDLNAQVLPAGDTQGVTWESLDTAKAAVDADGVVTSLQRVTQATDVTIRAKWNDEVFVDATVKIIPKATGVTLPATGVIGLSSTNQLQLTATIAPADAAMSGITWTSSNSAIATVSATGLVTGLSIGTVDITATVQGESATCAVTVKEHLYAIEISGESTVKRTKSITLTAAANPSTYTDTVTWSSSNISVATVNDQTGVVTGVAIGTAVITATSNTYAGIKATKEITVEYYADSVTVTSATGKMSFIDEGSLDLNAQVLPTGDTQGVTWVSLDTAKAAVDANGLVTSLQTVTQATDVTIRAKWNDEVYKDVTVTIIPKLTSLQITGDETIYVNIADTTEVELEFTAEPVDAKDNIAWTSLDTNIATVDATGKVTVLATGTVEISVTATDGSGLTDKVTIVIDNTDAEYIISTEGVTITEFEGSGSLVLPDVLFGKDVIAIGEGAFMDNVTITSVHIPAKVTEIPAEAFMGCIELTSVEIPNGVTVISERAFSGCIKLSAMNTYGE